MDWNTMGHYDKVRYLKKFDGQVVFATCEMFKIHAPMKHMRSVFLLTIGCSEHGQMDQGSSVAIYLYVGDISCVKVRDGKLHLTVSGHTQAF